jgi:hypothetical protein
MTDPKLADAASEFVLFARGGGTDRFHAAGEAMAEEMRRAADRPDDALAAFGAGLDGRRREPWGAEAREDAGAYAGRMSALAAQFPSLRGAPGVRPWNPCALDDWAASGASSGEKWAVSFLLWAVWNSGGTWRTRPFDLRAAWDCWDDGHRGAAMAWLLLPFRP